MASVALAVGVEVAAAELISAALPAPARTSDLPLPLAVVPARNLSVSSCRVVPLVGREALAASVLGRGALEAAMTAGIAGLISLVGDVRRFSSPLRSEDG